MRILITGANGQLGSALKNLIDPTHNTVFAMDLTGCDISNKQQVESVFNNNSPDVVLQCAAFTAVDLAEEQEELCNRINVEGTRNVLEACKKFGTKLVHISTDYVFSGDKKEPYEITDKPSPVSVYGKSKYMAEQIIRDSYDKYYIIRTAWMFGHGKNFVNTMLRLAQTNSSINVVKDQFGSPTYALDLASFIIKVMDTNMFGLYHATNEGFCCWADLAEEVFKLIGLDVAVNRILSKDYVTKAHRPANSRLSKKSLDENGFSRLPGWQDALKRYVAAL